jgi:hypothetical protein
LPVFVEVVGGGGEDEEEGGGGDVVFELEGNMLGSTSSFKGEVMAGDDFARERRPAFLSEEVRLGGQER